MERYGEMAGFMMDLIKLLTDNKHTLNGPDTMTCNSNILKFLVREFIHTLSTKQLVICLDHCCFFSLDYLTFSII